MCYISCGMRDSLLLTIFDPDDTTRLVNKAAYSITISVYEYYLQTARPTENLLALSHPDV